MELGKFWMCFGVGFVGQLAVGYPAAIIGVTLAQPSFLEYMGLLTTINRKPGLDGHANSLLGATNGAFQAGAFFGVLAGSYIMDKYGRKIAAIYSTTLSIIGGVCLCAAQNITMFIVFRFFAGAGAFAFVALMPVYTTELAPPKLRGFFVGTNCLRIALGYALASYIGLAFYYTKSPAAHWRAPLGLALIFPVAVLIVLLFIPESPRWLLMVSHVEEAREIVMKLHYNKNDADGQYSRSEFHQMQKQIEKDQTVNPTWMEMFTRPSYRKRTIVACGFAFIGQSTGILVINNYGPTIYAALGYNTLDQLILQCSWITLAIPSNVLGVCLVDRIGRKPLMLISVIGCFQSVLFIIPTVHVRAPAVPNFFLEAKPPSGNVDVAKWQATLNGALGARAMHKLQPYAAGKPVYDGNAYTITSSYQDGVLKMYTAHITPPAGRGEPPEYHLNQYRAFVLADTPDTCRQALTIFRNGRDYAKVKRDQFISSANERAQSMHAEQSILDSSNYSCASRTIDLAEESQTSADELAAASFSNRAEEPELSEDELAAAYPVAASFPYDDQETEDSESVPANTTYHPEEEAEPSEVALTTSLYQPITTSYLYTTKRRSYNSLSNIIEELETSVDEVATNSTSIKRRSSKRTEKTVSKAPRQSTSGRGRRSKK